MKTKRATKPLPLPRVRHEPPTVEEAFLAAQGLAEDPDQQVAIAAGLMGVPEDEVRPHLPKPVPSVPQGQATSLLVRDRVITVERRSARTPLRITPSPRPEGARVIRLGVAREPIR